MSILHAHVAALTEPNEVGSLISLFASGKFTEWFDMVDREAFATEDTTMGTESPLLDNNLNPGGWPVRAAVGCFPILPVGCVGTRQEHRTKARTTLHRTEFVCVAGLSGNPGANFKGVATEMADKGQCFPFGVDRLSPFASEGICGRDTLAELIASHVRLATSVQTSACMPLAATTTRTEAGGFDLTRSSWCKRSLTNCADVGCHAAILLYQRQKAIAFMGGGSTGKAAQRLGWNFVGIEQSAGYFGMASRWLAEPVA